MIFRIIIMFSILISFLMTQQESGQEYRRTAIHNGNLVKTVLEIGV